MCENRVSALPMPSKHAQTFSLRLAGTLALPLETDSQSGKPWEGERPREPKREGWRRVKRLRGVCQN
jgi:hypothetical protein